MDELLVSAAIARNQQTCPDSPLARSSSTSTSCSATIEYSAVTLYLFVFLCPLIEPPVSLLCGSPPPVVETLPLLLKVLLASPNWLRLPLASDPSRTSGEGGAMSEPE